MLKIPIFAEFEQSYRNKKKNIEFAIDAIRNRYGVNLIKKGRSI